MEALTELGHMYEEGGINDKVTGKFHKLTKKSIDKAREHYKEASDQGCALAMNYLGMIAFCHDKDLKLAVQYIS